MNHSIDDFALYLKFKLKKKERRKKSVAAPGKGRAVSLPLGFKHKPGELLSLQEAENLSVHGFRQREWDGPGGERSHPILLSLRPPFPSGRAKVWELSQRWALSQAADARGC